MATDNGSDPARSLAILWRTREVSSRKGKPELSVDRIARVAIELADVDGLDALSMRKVAEKLGVGTMSLYTYVPGKAELVDVMVDLVQAETARPQEGGDDWRAKLELIARENLALYQRHPWLLQASHRTVLGPNVIEKYEYELRALEGIGLTEIEMDSVLTLLIGQAQVSARGRAEMSRVERNSGLTEEQWWTQHAPLLDQVIDYSRFPVASRVGAAAGEAHHAAYSPEHAFEFGLARLLDGIEVLIGGRADAGS
ncbi:TetR/AcrR family transcriptional regulator [Amycolatopsis albispora]|uniref:TetR family transcriptional regulator n=1 Tax=Amycolatopsis albispora TaxID=1804986 RepID=A0A344L7L8_9PSEU|nr:TetR/AcrR family transcriptional regulator [Amycolatopsis albispora]AXB44042.1 TetR family transcriptional regulator [Amycolatopsis albispora]